jgi:hypothetical protein
MSEAFRSIVRYCCARGWLAILLSSELCAAAEVIAVYVVMLTTVMLR